jgi:uncharacterized membrane protein YdjX (TVP38/TMEM64 family)
MKRIAISLLILACIAVFWGSWDRLAEMTRWFMNIGEIVATVRGYGFWGPAVLFVLFVLQTFFAFIPGQGLMIASGYIYGFTGGILISWISLVAGGQAAFWLARRYGRPFAERWVAAPVLNRWDQSAAGRGVAFYVVSLVMPFFPNDAMCYVAGIGNMSARRFLTANILGRGIASFFTALVGAFGENNPFLIWTAIVVFIVLGIIGLVANKKNSSEHRLKNESERSCHANRIPYSTLSAHDQRSFHRGGTTGGRYGTSRARGPRHLRERQGRILPDNQRSPPHPAPKIFSQSPADRSTLGPVPEKNRSEGIAGFSA